MAAPDRKAIHVYVTDEARAAWHTFAEETGASLSALIEIRGQMLAKEIADAGDAADIHRDWVRAARKHDAANRRRAKP